MINAGPIAFLIGDFVGAIIDFVIIALVVFLVVKYMMKGDTSKNNLSNFLDYDFFYILERKGNSSE